MVKVLEPTAQLRLLARRPWDGYLTSQHLSLLLCEMEEIGEPT